MDAEPTIGPWVGYASMLHPPYELRTRFHPHRQIHRQALDKLAARQHRFAAGIAGSLQRGDIDVRTVSQDSCRWSDLPNLRDRSCNRCPGQRQIEDNATRRLLARLVE